MVLIVAGRWFAGRKNLHFAGINIREWLFAKHSKKCIFLIKFLTQNRIGSQRIFRGYIISQICANYGEDLFSGQIIFWSARNDNFLFCLLLGDEADTSDDSSWSSYVYRWTSLSWSVDGVVFWIKLSPKDVIIFSKTVPCLNVIKLRRCQWLSWKSDIKDTKVAMFVVSGYRDDTINNADVVMFWEFRCWSFCRKTLKFIYLYIYWQGFSIFFVTFFW